VDAAARDGVHRVGPEVWDDLIPQKTAVHQPAYPPVEDWPVELDSLQPGQLEQLAVSDVSSVGNKMQQVRVPMSQGDTAF